MTAEHTRLEMLAQHDRLRKHLQRCTSLARLVRVDPNAGPALDDALETLRTEFAAHNETETTAIRKLLHGPAAWGSLMIDRMLEEHVAEHAAFWDLLTGTRDEVSQRIDELADELEAHMDAEERTFLAPVTLRDDVIRVRTRETPHE